MTIYDISENLRIAYASAFTFKMVKRQLAFFQNIQNGFKAAGIFPYDPYVFSDVDFLCSYVSDQPIPANISTLSASLSSSISQPVRKTISVSIANVYDQTDPATKAYNLSKLSDSQIQTIHTPLSIVSEVLMTRNSK